MKTRYVILSSFACFIACVAHAKESSVIGIQTNKPESGRSVAVDNGFMVPFEMTIPGTDVTFSMTPVPGGKFIMGSPDSEADREDHESPQVEVSVSPVWIGTHEITWAEYKEFMDLYESFKQLQTVRGLTRSEDKSKKPDLSQFSSIKTFVDADVRDADAITTPTPLYDSSTTFEHGEDPQQPAVTITQYAAKQYTKWLSGVTGLSFRLPTEAEWEYACRAGAKTRFYFGNNADELTDHAWYYENSDERTHVVGQKKPNPWGLYDTYGNVAEWTVDAFADSGYDHLKSGTTFAVGDAVRWPKKLFPRVLRGGHWDDDAAQCRSASRMPSNDPDWKTEDPNIPLSPWWFTSYPASGVGFRIVRTPEPMSNSDKERFWEIDCTEIANDVKWRLEDGRGIKENAVEGLPQAISELKAFTKQNKLD